jgi:hypothetical protein
LGRVAGVNRAIADQHWRIERELNAGRIGWLLRWHKFCAGVGRLTSLISTIVIIIRL